MIDRNLAWLNIKISYYKAIATKPGEKCSLRRKATIKAEALEEFLDFYNKQKEERE